MKNVFVFLCAFLISTQGALAQFSSAGFPATGVKTNQANTYTTGDQNLSGATSVEVPTASTGDSSTKAASTSFVGTAVSNAIAAVNPAVAVSAATTTFLPNSPIYANGVGGVGATITTATTNTALVVDGHTMLLGERLLVKDESGGLGAAKNGVYYVSTIQSVGVAWVLTRVLDFNSPSDMNNTGSIPVVTGTVNGTTSWVLTSSVATVGTDALTFSQFTISPTTTQNTTLTNTHIRVGNGSNVATDVAVSGDITIANTGVVTASAATKAGNFGGDGSGGALNLSATESTIMQYNGTTVSVADGATATLISGTVINATSTITIGGGASGILKVAGISAGFAGGGAAGGAPNTAGGLTPVQTTAGALAVQVGKGGAYTLGGGGGSGGASWGASGAGGTSGGGGAGGSAALGFGSASNSNGVVTPFYIGGGPGGGGAGGQGSSNAAKTSGVNVGKIILCAVGNITVASGGSVNANGGVGGDAVTPDATGHGGGGCAGGGAGVLCAYSLGQVIVTGTMSANGGLGGNGGAAKAATNGNGGGGGSGGGGGIALRMSTTAPGGGGTYQAVKGGPGSLGAKDGAGSNGVAGSASGDGTAISLTGSPNFPLIVMHQKYLWGSFGQVATAKAINGEYKADMREHCSMMAALECQQRWNDGICFVGKTPMHGQINEQSEIPAGIAFQQMQHHFYTSTEWVPNNAVAILNHPEQVQSKLDAFTCETLTNPEHGLYCGGLGEIAGDQV